MANSRTEFSVSGAESGAGGDIEEELEDQEGVQLVAVDGDSGVVEVRYGEELISEREIKTVVRDLGYDVDDGEDS